MLERLSSYYRQFVPHSIRHGIRLLAYRLIYLCRRDRFVSVDSEIFKNKAEELYCENNSLFYAIPQHAQEDMDITTNGSELKDVSFYSRVFKLNKVSCFGASDIIQLTTNHYLYEVRDYYRKVGKTTVSARDVFPLYIDERDYYVLHHVTNAEHFAKGILLSSYFASNYYHFTFQCLAKLRLCGIIDKNVPLLVNASVAKIPSFQQLLQICNVDQRQLIYLSSTKKYDVDELYYISPQMISVPNYRVGAVKMPDDDLYMCESLDYLRKMMLPHMDKNWTVPERVFLARRYATDRRGYNEEECYNMLKPYDFVEVRPETLTLGHQIALFNKAKCIVGATGAAFTNLIYGSADCKYVVLKNARSEESIFSSLAAFNRAKLIYLCDSSKGIMMDASHEHDSFHIDPNNLKKLIEQII